MILDAKRVLAFNRARTLIAVFRSVRSAGLAMKTSPQSISNAASGASITSCSLYWRIEHPEFEIEMTDLGSLTLSAYDKMCVEKREYSSATVTIKKKNKDVNKKPIHKDIIA